jgi:hypothetical protein
MARSRRIPCTVGSRSTFVDGVIESLQAADDVQCGAVSGDIEAGGNVTCGDVGGDVEAGANVTCGSVAGDVGAGGKCHQWRCPR